MRLQCKKDASTILSELERDLMESYRTARTHYYKEFLYGQMLGVLNSFVSLGLFNDVEDDAELVKILDIVDNDIQFEREVGY